MPCVLTAVRSAIAYTMMLSNAVLSAGWMCLFARNRSLAGRLHLQQRFCRRNRAILATVCGLRCRVEGEEHLPDPPYVILSLHQSSYEALVFPALFPPFVWILKKSLVGVPVLGPALARLEPVAIDRDEPQAALKQVLVQGQAALAKGVSVLVFPEGTRFPPGAPGRFRGSGVALAARGNVPVIPVALDSGAFWGAYSFIIRPGLITVRIGQAVMPTEMAGRSPKEINDQLRRRIETMMAAPRELV